MGYDVVFLCFFRGGMCGMSNVFVRPCKKHWYLIHFDTCIRNYTYMYFIFVYGHMINGWRRTSVLVSIYVCMYLESRMTPFFWLIQKKCIFCNWTFFHYLHLFLSFLAFSIWSNLKVTLDHRCAKQRWSRDCEEAFVSNFNAIIKHMQHMILLNRNKGPQGSFAGTPKENSVGDIQEKHTNTCFDGSPLVLMDRWAFICPMALVQWSGLPI